MSKTITDKTLIPKKLADSIVKEVEILLNKGWSYKSAIKQGVKTAAEKWKEKHYGERDRF